MRNIPHCCPPKESGPCLSPCLADHPLRPATRRRLGRPLPHQQADRPQAHPEAPCGFRHSFMRSRSTSGISAPFDALFPTSGQVAYVLLNRSPLARRPKSPCSLDLHTLGTPQAFVLSQDQTLHQVLERARRWALGAVWDKSSCRSTARSAQSAARKGDEAASKLGTSRVTTV